jgi:hypothetical protein
MDNACKEFLKALRDAEAKGASLDVTELGKKINLPPGQALADVFEKCKEKGWVMGTWHGPWLTPHGKIQASSAVAP